MKHILLLLVFNILCSCSNALVNESYATIGEQSINGVDAFKSVIEDKAQKFISKSWMSRLILDDADLVVYFSKNDAYYDDQLLRLEAYLQRTSPEELSPENELINEPKNVLKENTLAASKTESDNLKERLYSDNEKRKTILYFLKDTTASVAFFERVVHDLRGAKKEQNHIANYLNKRKQARQTNLIDTTIPFGQRHLLYRNGPLIFKFDQNTNALPTPVSFFPVRYVPGISNASYINSPRYESILSVSGGDLIRVHYFEKVRLILVYNSEPFLNYSIVRPQYKTLTIDLINYALQKKSKPVIAYIAKGLFAGEEPANQRENRFKVLTVFPVNIIILQFVIFLVFYLLNKWPHQSHPLPMKSAGSRTFIEHFKALGIHLKRARDKNEVLESLIQYRKIRGFQTKIINSDSNYDPDQ